MSDTNPYAPKTDAEIAHVAAIRSAAPAPVAGPEAEEQPTAPEPVESSVPEGTIAEVLAWVGESAARAELALSVEAAGQNRKSLVRQLRSMAL